VAGGRRWNAAEVEEGEQQRELVGSGAPPRIDEFKQALGKSCAWINGQSAGLHHNSILAQGRDYWADIRRST